MAGARDYNEDGKLNSCPAVQEHKDKLRKESDSLSGWIMDCCIKGENEELQASKGYADYVQYAKRCNRKVPPCMTQFNMSGNSGIIPVFAIAPMDLRVLTPEVGPMPTFFSIQLMQIKGPDTVTHGSLQLVLVSLSICPRPRSQAVHRVLNESPH